MTKIFRAQTLDDALQTLSESIASSCARGEKNLVFCEDRITLLAERAVLRGAGGGTFDTEVTTFARYLSGREVRRISKEGSVVKISELILDGRTQDGCFNNGSARAVYETIAQLSASGVDEEMLLGAAASDGAGGMLARKLKDLARIYGAYRAFLQASGRVDENGYLALLKDAIEEDALEEVNVYFFAFPSFTKQAMQGVQAAFSRAKSVTGIFIGGDAPIYTNRAVERFREYAERAEGKALHTAEVPCTLAEDAKNLRDSLFVPVRQKKKAKSIRSFEAEDETREAQTVAALVKRKICEGLRYRDIVVLVSGEAYFLPLEKAFSEYGIPFYAEKKRKLSSHPFAEYLFAVLDAVEDGALPEEADAVASNVCFGEADEYRNYLLRYGAYRGAVNAPIKEGQETCEYDGNALLDGRARMKSVLSLFKRSGTGREFTDGVRKLFARTRWDSVQKRLETLAGENGLSAAEKNFLSVTLDEGSSFGGVLDEIDLVAGERKFGAREFSVLLRNGLDALGTSMIPPCSDVVFVGDATESRFTRAKVVFAMGLTDALPRKGDDTAIITDGEIGRLKDIQVEIEPAIAEVNRRSREGLALNLCAFENELYLSRPLQLSGAETEKSEALRDAEKAFLLAPMPALFPFDCGAIAPARLRMAFAKPDGSYAGNGALYAALDEFFDDGERKKDKIVFTGEEETAPSASALWLKDGTISPTALENYFSCPYQGFAKNALWLSERNEGSMRAADAGTFVHEVLKRAAAQFNEIGSEEELLKTAREKAEELLKEAKYRAVADTVAGVYASERLISESCAVVDAAWKQLHPSKFRVFLKEERIASKELNIEGTADRVDVSDHYVCIIDYKTGNMQSYDSIGAYYMGKRLQLQLYLLAVLSDEKLAKRNGERKKENADGEDCESKTVISPEKATGESEAEPEKLVPAGAFYFPAANSYLDEKDGAERFTLKGFCAADEEIVKRFDPQLKEGEKSAVFGGTYGKYTNKAMPLSDFYTFLEYARLVTKQAQAEIKDGNIRPLPYAKSCEYCKLMSLCGFTGKCRKGVKGAMSLQKELLPIVREARKEETDDGIDG